MSNPDPSPSTRFPPGSSGNPAGSSTKARLRAALVKLLDDKGLDARFAEAGMTEALSGVFPFWKEILNRVDGRVPEASPPDERPTLEDIAPLGDRQGPGIHGPTVRVLRTPESEELMSNPTWTEIPDPGGPLNNYDRDTYAVVKGYVDFADILGFGPSVLAVGDVFNVGGSSLTVSAINLTGDHDPVHNPSTVSWASGGTLSITSFAAMNWVTGVPVNKRTHAASALLVRGHQFPSTS